MQIRLSNFEYFNCLKLYPRRVNMRIFEFIREKIIVEFTNFEIIELKSIIVGRGVNLFIVVRKDFL